MIAIIGWYTFEMIRLKIKEKSFQNNTVARIDTIDTDDLKTKNEESPLLIEKYRYSKNVDIGVGIPHDIINFLPDPYCICIEEYGDSSGSGSWIRGLNPNDKYAEGSFVRYCVNNVYKKERDYILWGKMVFSQSHHPFLMRYTKEISDVSARILNFIGYNPDRFGVTKNELIVEFCSGYYATRYIENPDYIDFSLHYQESFHDGGGSGSCRWVLRKSENNKDDVERFHDNKLDGIKLPECSCYWLDNGHLFLHNPWGIPGVFELFSENRNSYDYLSDEEVKTVGCL